MALSDLIVVHFAFGSPFAVYRLTRGNIRSARSAAAIGAYFALWPLFAAAFIRQWLSQIEIRSGKRSRIKIENQISAIQAQLEQKVFGANKPIVSIFEFREVFSRFAGLSIALLYDGAFARHHFEFFEISGHRDVALASKCINRRHRLRLLLHRQRAREEFVNLICHVTDQNDDSGITLLAAQLIELLDDGQVPKQKAAVSVGSK